MGFPLDVTRSVLLDPGDVTIGMPGGNDKFEVIDGYKSHSLQQAYCLAALQPRQATQARHPRPHQLPHKTDHSGPVKHTRENQLNLENAQGIRAQIRSPAPDVPTFRPNTGTTSADDIPVETRAGRPLREREITTPATKDPPPNKRERKSVYPRRGPQPPWSLPHRR